ncbi:MAG: hypothetical protein SGJ09_13065 [Phycisphaerae bacterium]|nr:hypothetical protein [Phycisphaerae bacterium]
MKRISVLLNVVAAGVGATALSGAAAANGLTLTFQGFGPSLSTAIHYDASASYGDPTANSFDNIPAGQIKFSGGLVTYCLQVFEGLPPVGGTARWDLAPLASLPEAPPAPGPMGGLLAELVTDLYARHYYGSLATAADSAAFQVVLWELTHENFDESGGSAIALLSQADLSLGAFQLDTSSSIFALAAAYLADLGAGGTLLGFGGIHGLTNPQFQDLLTVVPIPAPVLLGGLGLLGVAVLRRRVK